jgi:diguanylate cyclase (GGDEF)-like protein
MTDQDPGFDPVVLEALKNARDLPSVPAVALEVLRVAQDEDASAEDLAAVVSLDPALAAKVLKVANSALFARRTEVTTLHRACAQLGFKTVKLWALSFTMVDSLDHREIEGLDYGEYWKRSLVRAVSAKLVAEAVAPKLADEAFITGLLSRIGQLVLANCLPGEYKAVLAATSESWPSRDLQKKTLGYSSDELGAALLYTWKLPPMIYEAVRCAEDVPNASDNLPAATKKLAQIVTLAASCEELVCGTGKCRALMALQNGAKTYFGFEAEQVETLLTQVDQRVAEIADILRIKIKDGLDMAAVLRTAQLELLRETITLLHHSVVSDQRAAQLQFENSLLLLKAQTDPVTGLSDRNTFQETLASCAVKESDASHRLRAGLLRIAVDNFEEITDEHGVDVGDRVLQLIARVVRDVTGESDLAARYEGEEFAVVMPQVTVEELPEVAERIRRGVEKQRLNMDTGEVAVTVSVGGAHTEVFDSPVSPDQLIEIASRHAGQARRKGGNQYYFSAENVSMKGAGA